MSFIGDLFGGGATKTTNVSQASSVPIQYSSPQGFYSNVAGGRAISAGPTGVQISGDQNNLNAYSRFAQNNALAKNRVGSMITNLQSNQNPFIQARVNPYQQAMNERRGLLSRDLSRRGVQGSLANNELIKFDREAQSGLADQRALATNESLNSLLNAETANMNLNQDELNLVKSRLQEDLGLLGLNMTALQLIRNDVRQLNQVAGGISTTKEDPPMDILGTLAKLAYVAG